MHAIWQNGNTMDFSFILSNSNPSPIGCHDILFSLPPRYMFFCNLYIFSFSIFNNSICVQWGKKVDGVPLFCVETLSLHHMNRSFCIFFCCSSKEPNWIWIVAVVPMIYALSKSVPMKPNTISPTIHSTQSKYHLTNEGKKI